MSEKDYNGGSPSYQTPDEAGESHAASGGLFNRFVDSFKRAPASSSLPGILGADGQVYDVEGTGAAAATAESPLSRHLKGRHLQMIAIGGSIGVFLYEFLLLSFFAPPLPPQIAISDAMVGMGIGMI